MKNYRHAVHGILGSCLLLIASISMAQQPMESPQEEFDYEMQQEGGNNASAVAWHAKKQVYVTVIAGNQDFPLEVFSGTGEPVSQTLAGFDWRGMWYNPSTSSLEGNGAGEYGWASFTLDADNSKSELVSINEGQLQPDFNAVGAYDAVKKQVVFIDFAYDGFSMYARKNPKKVKHLNLDFSSSDLGNMNSTTVGVTGHSGFDFVLLDFQMGKLVFFNRSGQQTATSDLPEHAPLNDSFAFSFANDHAFLYDKDSRVWHAYKIW